MRALPHLVPIVIVALLTILAAAPWGVGANGRFLLPLVPFLAIAHWALLRPGQMPAGLAFASGLCLDVLTNGPLGYWSFVFLSGHLLALWMPSDGHPALLQRWLHFLPVMGVVVLVEWCISSLYFMRAAEVSALLWAASVAIATFPILSALLMLLEPRISEHRALQLERRG